MKYYVGSDHAGFKTKEALKKYLEKKKAEIVDIGTFDEQKSDYPDFAKKVAQSVVKDRGSLGILVCGTGIGMSISANKIKGARAANPFDEYTARVAREHNRANILCLGGRPYRAAKAKKLLEAFLEAKPSNEGRHKRRVEKITEIENNNLK